MEPRFFVDETDLALGKALARVYADVVYPGHSNLPEVPRGSRDDDWLPVVGSGRFVVITRDMRIRYRPVERRLWIEHRVRGFVLTGRKSQSTDDSVKILHRHRETITTISVDRAIGAWMYAVTRERLREIPLE